MCVIYVSVFTRKLTHEGCVLVCGACGGYRNPATVVGLLQQPDGKRLLWIKCVWVGWARGHVCPCVSSWYGLWWYPCSCVMMTGFADCNHLPVALFAFMCYVNA